MKKCEAIFKNRIEVLQKAIANFVLESSFLQHCVTGNYSYLNSFSLLKMEMGYRYGASFRLWEISEALKTRSLSIGINDKDNASASADVAVTAPSSPVINSLTKISSEIDTLKEEVMICNEAFKKEAAELVERTDLPRKYYIFHKQRLDAIEAAIAGIQTEATIDKRMKEIERGIQLESSTPNSPKSLAYQQERAQIPALLNKILQRQAEVKGLLNERKVYCKLDEKGLDTKEVPQLANFGGAYGDGH